jgi:hypothetical protein
MKTTLLALLLLVYLPMVVVTTAAVAVFNQDACVQCVGSFNGTSTANFTGFNEDNSNIFNDDIVIYGNGGIYCDQGGDEYVCLTGMASSGSSSNICSGNSYTDELACTGVLDDVVGIAKSIITVIAVLACCCCAAIIAGIAGCIYCCVKGNNAPLPAGVPGAYQTNPALLQQQQQQSVAPKPALHLPGTLQMAPVNTTPAQTGLTTAYQPNYQPNYQTQSQTNIPFAEALSVEHDGTTKTY